jgi:hypothetical protein
MLGSCYCDKLELMEKTKAAIYEESAPKQKCRHHWKVDMAAGPTSQGTCILCGAQKEFRNYLPDCLAVDKKVYEEWLRRQRDDKGRKGREDIL